ncbi:AraC-like DNA-binding protein [Parabacteroides sp. PFB2-10]|uniref:AraC family transcriptional regulator n=1 Tax=Parabacteroides sp. PFB2-10 TaxID=1742405 RepID=UPI002476CBA8|nr:helix-turn-helix domain-containing protein [Parabacteroides sp. PFB2-10]MDH6312702.1 AraC-like DNA-binding protein [Parabacteroides sp. PFB2-10]MDL2244048.1 helix-turn-helix domain-containing protein [Parabacteroides sp. OttesenSCG-928-J18]
MKIFSKLAVGIVCVLCFSFAGKAEAEHRYSHLEGKERLDSLLYFVDKNLFSDSPTAFHYINILEKEARQQDNVTMIAYALVRRASYHSLQYDTDSIFESTRVAEGYLREHKNYNDLFVIQLNLLNRLLYKGEYAQAIRRGRAMYEEAKEIGNYTYLAQACTGIGVVNKLMGFGEEALIQFKEALRYLQMGDKPANQSYMDLCRQIAGIYSSMHIVPDSALVYADLLRAKCESLPQATAKLYGDHYNFFAAHYAARAYLGKGEPEKALLYLTRIDSLYLAGRSTGDYKEARDRLKHDYYATIGDYTNALPYINAVIDFQKANNFFHADRYNDQAKTLFMLGRKDEALEIYVDLHERLWKERIDDYNTQVAQLRIFYELDKMELQMQKDKLQIKVTNNRLMFFITASLLLAVITLLVLFNMRRMRKKNIGLVQRIREQDRLKAENERLNEELEKNRLTIPSNEQAEQDDLMLKLKTMLRENPLYTDPSVNRKALADMLGTNENYLRTAIKEKLDLTVNEYINELRLDHAKKLLAYSPEEYTIEDIALASGFGTRSTFHRQFRKKYELSPDEYRKIIRKETV